MSRAQAVGGLSAYDRIGVRRLPVTFEDVASIGCTLEDVERTTAWGQPALKVRGRMFVCMAAHRSAEPNSLVVMMDHLDRDALITDAPDTYYLKDHYLNHPCVLVRLSHVRRDALRDVVVGAYRFVQNSITSKSSPSNRSRRSPRRR